VEAYGGPMTVEVVVGSGKVKSVDVVRHWETHSYLVMAQPTARQIVARQSFEGVDVITGATVTSDAIINAAAAALANAME
jgi:fumarate reductase flavoprotein subunit